VIASTATPSGFAALACQAHCCPELLSGGNLSLVAQGTRLNC
jgi:hypothetical protein